MKRLIILIMIISAVLCGCTNEGVPQATATPAPTQKPTAIPAPTSTPTPELTPEPTPYTLSYKDISIEDGLITMQVPQSLTEAENFTGSLYLGYGFVKNPDNEDVYIHVSISSLYQVEDSGLTYEIMDKMVDITMLYPHGNDIELTRIGYVDKENGIKGYQSKCVLFDGSEFNYINLAGNGRYYSIKVYTEDNSVPESEIYKILDSVVIDAEKEKSSVDGFEINMDGTTYYSAKLEGASIETPENWNPSESLSLTYNNTVISITSNDNLGTITARKFDKKNNNIDSLQELYAMMSAEVANRGFITFEQMAEIKGYVDVNGRNFIVYPAKISIVQYLLEYNDAFYCIEATYMGSDQSEANKIMEVLGTFTAPGVETLYN